MKKYVKSDYSLFDPYQVFEVVEMYYDPETGDHGPLKLLKKFETEDRAKKYADKCKARDGKECCVYSVTPEEKIEIYNTADPVLPAEEIESGIYVYASNKFSRSEVKELHDDLLEKAAEVLQSEDFGFDLKEVADILFIDETVEDDRIRVEVRCEVSYEGMRTLCRELDKIIQKWDNYAYFDDVAPGISEAYIYETAEDSERESIMSSEKMMYRFYRLTPEDRSVARRDYHLEVISETNDSSVVRGKEDDIYAFSEEYLGHEIKDHRKIEECEKVYGAYYGGAYDIDPEMFFTREDILDFSDCVVDRLNASLPAEVEVQDVYMKDPSTVHIEIISKDETAFAETDIKIDMRRIKTIKDLKTKYCDAAVQDLESQISVTVN